MTEKTGRFSVRHVIIGGAIIIVALLALAFGVWRFSKLSTMQLFGELIHRVETDRPVIALTFDDGPTPEYTAGVLAELKRQGVKATFFLIGSEAEHNIEQTRAIIADGHEIGNHTYRHSDMTFASEGEAASEVEKTDAVIRAAGYQGEIHFRPPFGKKLIGLPLYLARHDRKTITWDVEPDSDPGMASDPRRMVDHALETSKPGSIILLHVMYPSRETSRQALPRIIDGLQAKGFDFVTVSELLAFKQR